MSGDKYSAGNYSPFNNYQTNQPEQLLSGGVPNESTPTTT